VQPLTPVSETSEPPESPSPYAADFGSGDGGAPPGPDDDGGGPGLDDGDDDGPEPPPAAVPFKRLFACADRLDWALMAAGGVAAAAHGVALVVYLHLFGKAINSLHGRHSQELFDNIKQVGRPFLVTADLNSQSHAGLHVLLDSVEWDTCASFILVDLLKEEMILPTNLLKCDRRDVGFIADC
jgi:hypothetical protein